MAFEIPSARIRDLQVALRRESGFAAYDPADPSLPPLPSVADALAALDPPDLPSSLRCGRCGSGGGLLHGQLSTLCVYCGADRGRDGFSHSISFYSTAACRKLLDYLGLDGSEAVQLEIEPSSSSKVQTSAAPKDELVLSDLLDFKLKWPSDEKVSEDGTSKMPSTSMHHFNITGLDIGTFFTEAKRETSTISSKPNEQFILREPNLDTVNNASASSENFAAFEDLQSSKPGIDTVNANDRQFGTSFSAWEAEFQPDRPEGLVIDPKTNSGSEFPQAPESEAGFNQAEKKEQENSTKSNDGGFLNEASSTSSVNNQVPDELLNVKLAERNSADQLKREIDSREDDYEIHDSSWPINTTKESEKPMSTNSNDDLFYEWKGSAISSVTQENLLDPGVQVLFKHPSEANATDIGSTTNKTELEFDEFVYANDDSYDDWQDASSTIRQEKSADLGTKSVVMSSEHPLETKSDNLIPTSGKLDSDDSFDDWQDFTSSNKGQEAPLNLGAQSEVTFFEHPLETNSVDVFPSNKMESSSSLNINNNDDIFDPWQGFAISSKTKENMLHSGAQSMDTLLDYSSGAKIAEISSSGPKDLDNNKFFDYNDDSFDSWQGFSSSSGQILSTDSTLSKQHSAKTSVEPWPFEPANGGDESFDSWLEFTSSSEPRGNSQKSGQPTDAELVDRSSETMLASSENIVFDSLDPLFHTSGIQNYSTDRNDNKINSITSNRINNATHPDSTEMSSNIFQNSNAASNEESGKSKIEMLMSQIPDLSFMLTDELSLPVKLDTSDSKS